LDDDDEPERGVEGETGAALAHRCVYLSVPLLCTGILVVLFFRILFNALYHPDDNDGAPSRQ
jgi:hypothetical protein